MLRLVFNRTTTIVLFSPLCHNRPRLAPHRPTLGPPSVEASLSTKQAREAAEETPSAAAAAQAAALPTAAATAAGGAAAAEAEAAGTGAEEVVLCTLRPRESSAGRSTVTVSSCSRFLTSHDPLPMPIFQVLAHEFLLYRQT